MSDWGDTNEGSTLSEEESREEIREALCEGGIGMVNSVWDVNNKKKAKKKNWVIFVMSINKKKKKHFQYKIVCISCIQTEI